MASVGPAYRRLSWLTIAIVALQFFHWFNPSEGYFYDFAARRFHVTGLELSDDIFAYDVAFQLAGGLLQAILFHLVSGYLALSIASAAAASAAAIVLFCHAKTWLLLSQAAWGLSFTVLYVAPALIINHEDPDNHAPALAANSAAMLSASLSASLIGFILTMTEHDSASSATFIAALVSASASALLCLPVFWAQRQGRIHAAHVAAHHLNAPTRHPYRDTIDDSFSKEPLLLEISEVPEGPDTYRTACMRLMRQRRFWFWLLSYCVARGAHTLCITLWSVLSADVDDREHVQRFNGLVLFLGYAAAALLVLAWGSLRRSDDHLALRAWLGLLIIMSLSLSTLALLHSYPAFAILFVVYNCSAELLLVVVLVQLAALVVKATDLHVRRDVLNVILFARFTISLTLQSLFQLGLFPKWGRLDNILGLDLPVRTQFVALGVLVAILSACVGLIRLINHLRHGWRWTL
ncbi:uncharacterized protein MONBRDRAFT_26398 [Monosiga brevicollis MX1]|uniref:Uncharacterized protein n=1 Tax=Monosiga brevicollis TaxID=81824 RepID=A9V291_MONBE|nr:uncharacterized protein MONBRDRAFT_26398 [Monosiga brevicollis MX1]EDQ88335.1 predicted protein [Monosiga brevicollis MX1]|eukprot:XP_001746928.1 hypothetical protein [Monosiga brevicollis MX1]